MDKIWLKHYPPGMPSEVDLHEYASMRDTRAGQEQTA